MSTKVRISYEQEPELLDVIATLGKRVVKVDREPAKGRFKRAYLTLKDLPKQTEHLAKQG